MPNQPDPILTALASLPPASSGGQPMKVVRVYGDRPDILEAIRQARLSGRACDKIARAISTDQHLISEAAVRKWLRSQGID